MKKGYLLSNPGNGIPDAIKIKLKKDIPNNEYNIVFIPCNYEQTLSNKKYHKINTDWFVECNIFFKSNILLNKDMTTQKIKSYIKNANILFLMGGLQLEQMKFCYDKNIVNDITNFDGIIIGICAGAINMASNVTSLYMSNMTVPIQTYYRGFSLVDFNIISHFSLDEKFNLLNNDYIILPDDSAVVISGNKTEFIGPSKAIKKNKVSLSFPDFDDLQVACKDKFILLLVNLVFVNCNSKFINLNRNQISELKQMFKYLIIELNMNYKHFVNLFYKVKKHYKLSNDDNLSFLQNEYIIIKKSLSNAKKEILRNYKMPSEKLEALIYDRYGVKVDEANRF